MKLKVWALVAPVAVLAAVLVSGGAAPAAVAPVAAHQSLQTTTLANDVVPSIGSYTDLGPVAADQQMNVVVPLQHDDAAIAAYENSLNDPSSPNYEHWLTPDQFQAQF